MSIELGPRFAAGTGAAGGIETAIVREFAAAGYTVVATDIVPQPRQLSSSFYLQADLGITVADDAYAEAMLARRQDYLHEQGLAALVNDAGVQILGAVNTLNRTDCDQTFAVNLLAPFSWTHRLLAALEHVQGCAVNISSTYARLTEKNFATFATKKVGVQWDDQGDGGRSGRASARECYRARSNRNVNAQGRI
jgi:NAD(P)-dependent dehydrogenase (short-subunit alcohol dehydrogenase family)